jgi:hypothetical protein
MADDRRHRYLDQPFVTEILSLEHIRDLLRPLTRAGHSALPSRMRTHCARLHREVSGMLRELRRDPDTIIEERTEEERRP